MSEEWKLNSFIFIYESCLECKFQLCLKSMQTSATVFSLCHSYCFVYAFISPQSCAVSSGSDVDVVVFAVQLFNQRRQQQQRCDAMRLLAAVERRRMMTHPNAFHYRRADNSARLPLAPLCTIEGSLLLSRTWSLHTPLHTIRGSKAVRYL